ncbi:putative quinol monooxygenase [Tropicimonas sp. IMCC6043]|uniref:putative quinol monooxygenase n=1 Tax=Tropicimonas sp. IMCC6043 TaxID=2510645 RepID=UPI00101D1F9D|nr:putative quinol monooxygenase [Tropicimonas sp. IMCC6043]RYH11273.1 antibiotic biosynthesis monooxygenase [Tropicimonas sp. IMCC6043]
MYAVTVSFTLRPGRMAEFMPLMEQNARTSLAEEPGCRRFDICSDPGSPGIVFLYELYDDRAAFEVHLQSAHFNDFDRAISDMVAHKSVSCFSEVRS